MSGKSDKARFSRKKLFGPKMGQLGPKRGKNEVLSRFLAQYALVFPDFAYYDKH